MEEDQEAVRVEYDAEVNENSSEETVPASAWPNDKLNRKQEGEWLADYLINKFKSDTPDNKKHFVLNVNADWGFGKTYFLENLSRELDERGHQTVYFDAWKNDFSDKPLLAFISEINESLAAYMDSNEEEGIRGKIQSGYKTLKKAAMPIIAGFVTRQLVGGSLDQFRDMLADDTDSPSPSNDAETASDTSNDAESKSDLEKNIINNVSSIATKAAEIALEEHKNTKHSIITFKKELQKLVQLIEEAGKKPPLFILIDELDRCRPTYAIELLETIKHLFEAEGVYFIIATATDQLSHSINAVYGNSFESKRYLNRFFDQEYKLSEPELIEYSSYLWKQSIPEENKFESAFPEHYYFQKYPEFDLNIILLAKHAEYSNAGLRDINQAIMLLNAIELTYPDRLFSNSLFFLVFCKIRHPDLYVMISKVGSKNYLENTTISNYVSNSYRPTNLEHLTYPKSDPNGDRGSPLNSYTQIDINNVIQETLNIQNLSVDILAKKTGELSAQGYLAKIIVNENQDTPQFWKDTYEIFPDYIKIINQVGQLL